jgi:hypothetical protein
MTKNTPLGAVNYNNESDLYMLECILTPSHDLAYIEGAAPINPICVQLLHQYITIRFLLVINYLYCKRRTLV